MPLDGWIILAAVAAAVTATPLVIAAADATSTQASAAQRSSGPLVVCLGLAGMTTLLIWQRGPALTAMCAPLLLIGAAAAVVDAREHRLPDLLTALLLSSTLLGIGLHSVLGGDGPAAVRAVGGLTIALGSLGFGKILRPDAMGWGDLKLAPSLGAYLGWISWQALYAGMLYWWLLILLTAATRAADRRRRGDPIPYGPAMILGTVLGLALM